MLWNTFNSVPKQAELQHWLMIRDTKKKKKLRNQTCVDEVDEDRQRKERIVSTKKLPRTHRGGHTKSPP